MQVWIDNQHKDVDLPEGPFRRRIEMILEELGLPDAEVSIVFVDDRQISELNLKYLSRIGPTNVIAFSMREGEGSHLAPQMLGDVVISLDTARREADHAGIPWMEHLYTLLVHGILHLIGYDHVGDEKEARRMGQEESRILKMLKDKMPVVGFD